MQLLPRPLRWPPIFPSEKNLFLWLPFNDRSGGKLLDRSGNNIYGDVYGATRTPDALSFDGSNDYVYTPDFGDTNTAPAKFNNDYTFMCWVKSSETRTEKNILAFATGSSWGDALCIDVGDVVWYCDIYNDITWLIGVTDIKDGKWHHLCGTRVRGGRVTLYIDGIFDVDDADPDGDHSNGYTHFSVGGDHLAHHCIEGEIRDCRVLLRALTAQEIKRHVESELLAARH